MSTSCSKSSSCLSRHPTTPPGYIEPLRQNGIAVKNESVEYVMMMSLLGQAVDAASEVFRHDATFHGLNTHSLQSLGEPAGHTFWCQAEFGVGNQTQR